MKRKATAKETKPPFTSVKRDTENFSRNENIKLQLACELALYLGESQKVTRVRGAGCEGLRGAFSRDSLRSL